MNRLQLAAEVALTLFAAQVWAVQPCADDPAKTCPEVYKSAPEAAKSHTNEPRLVPGRADQASAGRVAEEAAWATAKRVNNAEAYLYFLSQYSRGHYAKLAHTKLSELSQRGGNLTAAGGKFEVFKVNQVTFIMVSIPAGRLTMGWPSDPGLVDLPPLKEVTLRAFQIGQTEVTQELWQAVMGHNPSYFKTCGKNCPVEQVNWDNIQSFIGKLNRLTGQHFRLPSEAEWEYAARSGCDTQFSVGNQCVTPIGASSANLENGYDYSGIYKAKYRQKTLPVRSFAPNGFGLYDTFGNVDEWVGGCGKDPAAFDGRAEDNDTCDARILRGGSWQSGLLTSGYEVRSKMSPGIVGPALGFRLAKSI